MNDLRKTLPMYRDMGSLLENFFNLQQRDDASFIETSSWSPLVDIKEEKDCFLVVADIPGVKKEDVSISLEQHILTLKGERHFERQNIKMAIPEESALRGNSTAVSAFPKLQMMQKLPHIMPMEYLK